MRCDYVMNQAEGAAMRVQLDAMIAVLRPIGEEAEKHHDNAVGRLLDHLYSAAQEARWIERRPPLPQRKGVVLAKR